MARAPLSAAPSAGVTVAGTLGEYAGVEAVFVAPGHGRSRERLEGRDRGEVGNPLGFAAFGRSSGRLLPVHMLKLELVLVPSFLSDEGFGLRLGRSEVGLRNETLFRWRAASEAVSEVGENGAELGDGSACLRLHSGRSGSNGDEPGLLK